jgi:Na+/melibiose symporter-like transporter
MRFAMNILKLMGSFALIFAVMAIIVNYYFEATLEKSEVVLVISVVIYGLFILGWAMSYTTFFKFPDNQKILLLGIIIAAFIIPVVTGFSGLVSGQIEITKWLITVPIAIIGNLFATAVPMYFLVIVLRYIFRRRLTF